MKKLIQFAVMITALMLTSCHCGADNKKSQVLGDMPNIAKELINERLDLNAKLDKARAERNIDEVNYLRLYNKDLREEYRVKFEKASKEIIGNTIRAEVYRGMPFKITSSPTITQAVYDSTSLNNFMSVQFQFMLTTTEESTPEYFFKADEDEGFVGWYYPTCYMAVNKDGRVLMIGNQSIQFDLGGDEKNPDIKPTIPAGSSQKMSLDFSFSTRGAAELLASNDRMADIHKIVFLPNDEFQTVYGIMRHLWNDVPTEDEKAEENAKKEVRKATDVPTFYDVPYVVSTFPKNGSMVDSTITHVKIKFNYPMYTGFEGVGKVDDPSVIHIFGTEEETKARMLAEEEDENELYWEDSCTFVMTIYAKLESGKKYGVRIPTAHMYTDDVERINCEGDCDIIFTVK